MITVNVPEKLYLDCSWLSQVLFSEIINTEYSVRVVDGVNISLTCSDFNGALSFDTTLMHYMSERTDSLETSIDTYLAQNTANLESLKKFLSEPDKWVDSIKVGIDFHIGLDLFGIIFSYLALFQEHTKTDLDEHERVRSDTSSFSNILGSETPVVDIIACHLIRVLNKLWQKNIRLHKRDGIFVTCDVDTPYEAYTLSRAAFIRKLTGDMLKRKDLSEFKRTYANYVKTKSGDYSFDLNHTYDWMMDVNEKAGNKVAFYFLVDKTSLGMDGHYSIDETRIRNLMRRIYDRGHEIGLHASYNSFNNPEQIKAEVNKLCSVMEQEGIKQDFLGSRQHYLRWSTPETARGLSNTCIDYDTTLGYADKAGFRCGTSHCYSMYDLHKKEILKLKQKPLILMEATVFGEKYMDLGYTEHTMNYMKELKKNCADYGGTFTMLWHNSSFRNEEDKIFYQELINA